MKFTNEADKILNETKTYTNEICKYVEQFKVFCEDIIKANSCTIAEQGYKNIHDYLNDTINILAKIKDKYFNIKQVYDDKNRPNVLYPYEKQAIYEYFKKPDLGHKCYKKFGCIYAEKLKVNNKEIISIGISVCNDKDEFSKNVALSLARKRAREYFNKYDIRVTPETKGIPFTRIVHVPTKSMYEDKINMFIKRCKKWFKDETILYPTNIIFTEFPDKKKKKSDKITDEPMPF